MSHWMCHLCQALFDSDKPGTCIFKHAFVVGLLFLVNHNQGITVNYVALTITFDS